MSRTQTHHEYNQDTIIMHQRIVTPLAWKWRLGFAVFLLLHLLLWTMLPSLMRSHLPMDSIEGALWGQHLEWGYDKNPPINAWLTALAMHLSHYQDAAIYFVGAAAIAICFAVTWCLARRYLTPSAAFLSVLFLEGIQYYHLHAIDLSDNTLQLPLWMLIVYSLTLALHEKPWTGWIMTGLFAGISMITKYYSGFLLLSLVIFLLVDAPSRKALKTWPPYVGLCLFSIIIAPHIYWMFQHDFITIHYMLERTALESTHPSRLYYPMIFLLRQLLIFSPAALLFASLFIRNKTPPNESPQTLLSITRSDKRLLLFAAILPLTLTLILSLVFDMELHNGWGTPLLTLWPLLLFVYWPPYSISNVRILSMVSIIAICMLGMALVYSERIMHANDKMSANYPGQHFAKELTEKWHERFHTKLQYVGGDRFLAGSVGYYSKDHPMVWIVGDFKRSPWIDATKLHTMGGIYIMNGEEQDLPPHIKADFPIEKREVVKLSWLNTNASVPPKTITLFWLAPSR